MLRVTRDAAHLIRSLVARHTEIPRTGGLRIVTSVTAAERLQDRTLDAQVTGSRSAFFLDR